MFEGQLGLAAVTQACPGLRSLAGADWRENGLVFASSVGTARDPADVRRDFRAPITGADGVDPAEWTPRELRHNFVSLLSDRGVPVEEISRLVGHKRTTVTELVYRKQIRPVVQTGATAMDQIFGSTERASSHSDSHSVASHQAGGT